MNRRMRAACAALILAMCGAASAQPWVDLDRAGALQREEKFPEAAAIYGAFVEANPYHGFAWSQYGYCLHASKHYDEALKAYARAIELGHGRPTNLYNSACAHALLGHKDEALSWLEKALKARFADQQTLETDTDLDSLRADPRFARLTGVLKGLKEDPAPGRDAGWAWDLDFLIRRMEQMHWDLYAKVSRERFAAEVEKLKKEVPALSDAQARARLRKITALVGDGHTASRLNAEGDPRRVLPLELFTFKDGTYIIGADSAHQSLVGSRIAGVGNLKIDDALRALRPYQSVDNEMGYLAGGSALLVSPAIVHDMGASKDESSVEFSLEHAAKTEPVRVEAEDMPANTRGGLTTPGFTYVHDSLKGERPLFLRETRLPLRLEYLPEHKAVYFWFSGVTNPPGGTFREFCEKLFAMIQEKGAEHLIIDMRFNGGGNTGLVPPLLHGLVKCDAVNKKGHLWVLIGRNTFSAAQNTVNWIEKNTEATFVGEPTGSRPQFVGESTWFVLPHSKTRISCSSRYWQQMDSTDERTWVQPTIAAELTFADYAAGRDPGVDAIFKWIDKGNAQ